MTYPTYLRNAHRKVRRKDRSDQPDDNTKPLIGYFFTFNTEDQLNEQSDDLDTAAATPLPATPPSPLPTSSSLQQPPQAPSFKQVRRYLRTVEQREALGRFIAAGWTPAELAEYARSMYLASGQSKPAAVSYRFVIETGPDHERARASLATMRAPGFIMPPFDRPEPKHYEWDDHDNPAHPAGVREAVETLARGCMAAYDDRKGRPRRGPDVPISKSTLKRCFRELYANNAFGLRGIK